ncbi:hypothetical protein [Caulobacter sp. LjRoot300]|uniref:hypothetical protein n=1 Tax=Caulobacter sp. LjRoot300 TaxID=3342321 RepID=UPI003ECFD427
MRTLWLLPLAAALPPLAQAAEPAPGQVLLDARLRYETVSQDAPLTPKLSAELAAAAFDGDQPAYRDRTKMGLTLVFKL